jgi:hypothetical protein
MKKLVFTLIAFITLALNVAARAQRIVGMSESSAIQQFGSPDHKNYYDSGREEQWVYESGLILYVVHGQVRSWQKMSTPKHEEPVVPDYTPDQIDAMNAKNREEYKTPAAVVTCRADETQDQCDVRKDEIALIRKLDADEKNTPTPAPVDVPKTPTLAERLHKADIQSKCELKAADAPSGSQQNVLDACLAASK